VTDSILYRGQEGQSYALYLPTSYSPDKKYPCIYFFDAHARGALPVYTYKALAEQYGFVLIGSNISKNGMSRTETNEVVNKLMADAGSRIHIDTERVYLSGFSGGSRVASTRAMSNDGITGVIGCGAGFPAIELQWTNKFDYFGMAGMHDFNLGEMEQWDALLGQNDRAHQLLVSAGTHGWPVAADFQFALLWMQVMAMKEQKQAKDDKIVIALKQVYEQYVREAATKGDILKEGSLLEGMLRVLGGLADVSPYEKQLSVLRESDGYKQAMERNDLLQNEERQKEQEISGEFAARDGAYWAGKISEFNKNIRSKPRLESQMNGRLLAYLGLVAYMNSSAALKNGDFAKAAGYLKVFRLADPGNPDGNYLEAEYQMQKGDKEQAMASLKEAVSKGYNDVEQLMTDPMFNNLAHDTTFDELVRMAAANNRVGQ